MEDIGGFAIKVVGRRTQDATECDSNGGNGECDWNLNNEDCNYDGGDCCECQYQHLPRELCTSLEFGFAEEVRISIVRRAITTAPHGTCSACIFTVDETSS